MGGEGWGGVGRGGEGRVSEGTGLADLRSSVDRYWGVPAGARRLADPHGCNHTPATARPAHKERR